MRDAVIGGAVRGRSRQCGAAVRPGVVLVVVSAAAFVSSLDLFIVNIAFPAIRADFPGTDLGELSWILNGYTVVFAAFLALAGRLADRFGHRRIFLVGLVVFTVASAGCAAAPSVLVLVGVRAVQALGAALIMPTSLSLLLAAYPAEQRTRAVGTWASVGAVAAALGPPLGGLLVVGSWRWIFLVNLPVGIAAVLGGALLLREIPVARIATPDLAAAAGLIVGVGALAWAFVRVPDLGWADPQVLGALVLAAAGLGWVVRRSARHPVPALDLAVLRTPAFALAGSTMLVFAAGFAGMLFVNVLFLTGAWHYSTPVAGLALMPGPLVVVVVARAGSRVIARWGIGATAAVGALCFGAGALSWILRLGPAPDFVGGLLPGQLAVGLGVGLLLPTLSAAVGAYLPQRQWGSGSSLVNTARQIGSVLGVAVVVLVVGSHTSGTARDLPLIRQGWWVLVLTAAGAGALAVALAVLERRTARAPALPPPPPSAPDPADDGVRPIPLHGAVVDDAGTAVPGAIATVVDRFGRELARAGSDGRGRFTAAIDPAAAGPGEHAVLTVQAPAHQPHALWWRIGDAGEPVARLLPIRRAQPPAAPLFAAGDHPAGADRPDGHRDPVPAGARDAVPAASLVTAADRKGLTS